MGIDQTGFKIYQVSTTLYPLSSILYPLLRDPVTPALISTFLLFLPKTSHMSLTRHIPNIITLLNLFSGTIGVLYAVESNLVMAAVFVATGIFLDFFDGLAARLLDVKSELGLQLDSLADMVTS